MDEMEEMEDIFLKRGFRLPLVEVLVVVLD
jgi:hypothetical protein